MFRSKIIVFLILAVFALGFVMFKEVRGNVPAKSLTVMTYNVGTLNGEHIEFDKIGEVIRSRKDRGIEGKKIRRAERTGHSAGGIEIKEVRR